jgi:hypothetical protein
MEEKKNMGHAERASEGRTKWAAEWSTAWETAGRKAGTAESLAAGRAAGRRIWASVIVMARDSSPPPASDAEWNKQWTPAWDAAWVSAWAAAITAAKAVLEDRGDTLQPPKAWDATGRAARASAGLTAGCAAWNETYRAEIKKVG